MFDLIDKLNEGYDIVNGVVQSSPGFINVSISPDEAMSDPSASTTATVPSWRVSTSPDLTPAASNLQPVA